MENKLHSFIPYIPYYGNIREAYEITLLSVCPPLRPEILNSAARRDGTNVIFLDIIHLSVFI
jgi:hypothetical protein